MKLSVQSRREFIRFMAVLGIGATGVLTGAFPFARRDRKVASKTLWQIDASKCVQCGRCSTHCVLAQSAVKCVHVFSMCGYCRLCSGFFRADARNLDTAAENQLCPVGAIKRRFIEEPFYEYTIDEKLCVACGKCVKSCAAFGNGSLQLHIRHDICLGCNECQIAIACPAKAISRVSPENSKKLLQGI